MLPLANNIVRAPIKLGTATKRLWTIHQFLGHLMGWLIILILIVVGVPLFTWAYRRRLDVLTGPWIANEILRHD
jgi:hypothetical protein